MLKAIACTCMASLLTGLAVQLGLYASIHNNPAALLTAAFTALIVASAAGSAVVYGAMKSL